MQCSSVSTAGRCGSVLSGPSHTSTRQPGMQFDYIDHKSVLLLLELLKIVAGPDIQKR